MLSVNSSSVHAVMIYTHCCSLDHEEVISKAIYSLLSYYYFYLDFLHCIKHKIVDTNKKLLLEFTVAKYVQHSLRWRDGATFFTTTGNGTSQTLVTIFVGFTWSVTSSGLCLYVCLCLCLSASTRVVPIPLNRWRAPWYPTTRTDIWDTSS